MKMENIIQRLEDNDICSLCTECYKDSKESPCRYCSIAEGDTLLFNFVGFDKDNEYSILKCDSAKDLINHMIAIAELRGDMACLFLNDKYKLTLQKI